MITPGSLDSETLMRLSDTYPEVFPVENLHKFDVAQVDTKRSSNIADIIDAVASEVVVWLTSLLANITNLPV